MKSIAIAALLGCTSAIKMSNQDKLFNIINDDTFLQTGKVIENLSFDGYHISQDGHPGTQNEFGDWIAPYKRVIPERFEDPAADSYPVDKFTQNMLTKYAIEGIADKNDKNGKAPTPNGSFYLMKAKANEAAVEVLCTHFAQCADEGKAYLDLHFDDAWNYYDVNKTGKIDAIGVSQFFRYLTRPLGAIDLQ